MVHMSIRLLFATTNKSAVFLQDNMKIGIFSYYPNCNSEISQRPLNHKIQVFMSTSLTNISLFLVSHIYLHEQRY
jgi:hypothetical protein